MQLQCRLFFLYEEIIPADNYADRAGDDYKSIMKQAIPRAGKESFLIMDQPTTSRWAQTACFPR